MNSRLQRTRRQVTRNPLMMVGMATMVAWMILALGAPQIAPYKPLSQNINDRLQGPTDSHYFGTDELGRDIFSRVLYGGRITLPAGFMVIVFASVVGSLVGAVAGYAGGLWDEAIMRVTELFQAFPTIILALAVTAALGPAIENAVLALVIVWWPRFARLMRGMVLSIKEQEYVEAARNIGARPWYVLMRVIVPNAVNTMAVLAMLDVGGAILLFAGLSFLGLGPEPASPEWGRMVAVSIDFFDQWWMWLFPGAAIASFVAALNFIGDGLRDLIDEGVR
jgi:peptide/nickel transport system permease protein